ncbi:unnamed protein product [Microthlaspi erraticum]|uniref:SWIM-type domain-containing protein n=1 Tax=Microthlaspi erraticum TaxID=1685480 RepID=A0A6D2K096_9BRAS|nr:unnamed protein product [Microthlaspi erraticum]
MPMKIEELIKSCFRIVVSRAQCQAARNKARKWITREYEEQFSRLRDYGAEILESNPGSSVDIDYIKNAEGLDVFNRFYVCFDIIRRKWKNTCRPIIGVDGTFLKSTISGQLLVALGRDADNAIYPIAWCIVQVENTDNWLWFMNKIKADLGLEDGDNYILISDRQKGLISAARTTLPKIEHRMCVRHIYGNMVRVRARLTMVRIAKRDVIAGGHESLCTPYVIEYLEELLKKEKVEEAKVYRSTNNTWQVIHQESTHRVSLAARTCTCRRCEITGIPCAHAYAVILHIKGQPQEYVCHWFRTSLWRITYDEGIIPLRSARFWPVGDGPTVHKPPPPEDKEDKGDKENGKGEKKKGKGETKLTKKDKERKKGKNESPTKKKTKLLKRVMHCGICGEATHNSRFHDPKKNKNPNGDSSQVDASQDHASQGHASQSTHNSRPKKKSKKNPNGDSSQVDASQVQHSQSENWAPW